MTADRSLEDARCPDCGGGQESPQIIEVEADRMTQPGGETCSNRFHDVLRFTCFRHEPSVPVTACNPAVESYICKCKRCGRLIEFAVRTGDSRVA